MLGLGERVFRIAAVALTFWPIMAAVAEEISPISELLRSPKSFRLEMSLFETSPSSALISLAELRSSSTTPRRARRLYREALKLDHKGKVEYAMERLDAALSTAPHYFEAHTAAAVGCLKLGLLEEAETHLQFAQRLNPDYLPAREVKALILFARGQFKDAASCLRDLLKLAPTSKSAHYFLGRTLLRLGDEDQADRHLRRAEALHRKQRWDWLPGLLTDPLSSYQRPTSDLTFRPSLR